MSIIRPLVINTATGQIERAASADTVLTPDMVLVTNNTGGSLVRGTPVYQTATANEVAKAKADAIATSKVLGLVQDASIANAGSGYVLTDGLLTASTAEWDAVTGETGGLTPQARYFLDPTTAGKLTQTPPSVDGQVIAPVLTALSSTQAEISVATTIKL